ncbi:putative aB1gp47 [Acinetobacter baumannii]|uniref:hypothetical protein n=1 Tax=Acinetobacter baumannii TaxID=470 RepID=UPI00066A455B|nr:hypothetical protein [Acinetobacter baumannii]KMV07856.1 putative aB1gp47 [Acinetobacter baumannii]
MDNYKIKVNDEAESKEAQELFFELGYVWADTKCQTPMKFTTSCIYSGFEDGELCRDYYDENPDHQELTIPQLRDLVVLKRNDVKDATHEDQYGDKWLYLDERHYVYLNDQWDLPIGEFLERYELKPILPVKKQDPALISGADALRALADGKEVEFKHDTQGWVTCLGLNIERVLGGWHQMRLKPQTIKLELELPKPFEPEEDCHVYILDDGKTDGYRRYSYEVHVDKGNTFIGIWRTEDEIKQVVEQLRKIRGTNS